MARSAALLVLAVTCILIAAAPRKASAITCGQVVQYLSPCIPYARSKGGSVPPACCSGVKGLNAAATTTPTRQTACNCIKSTTNSIKGLNPGLSAGIPKLCGVNIPYAISMSTDCSKVK